MWIFTLICFVISCFNGKIIRLSITTILVCICFFSSIVYFIICKKFRWLFWEVFVFLILFSVCCFYAFILNDSVLIKWYYKITWSCPIWYDYSENNETWPICRWNMEVNMWDSVIVSIYYNAFWYDCYVNVYKWLICENDIKVRLLGMNDFHEWISNERCKEWWGNLSKDGEYFICKFNDWSYRKFKNSIWIFDYIQVDKDWNEMEYICSGWYDWCNSCGIGWACTQRYCSTYGQSRCDSWTSREELDRQKAEWHLPFYVFY